MDTTNFSILNALAAEIGEKRVLQMATAYIKYVQVKRDGIAPWAPIKRIQSQKSLESLSPRRLEFQEPLPSVSPANSPRSPHYRDSFPNQVFSDDSF